MSRYVRIRMTYPIILSMRHDPRRQAKWMGNQNQEPSSSVSQNGIEAANASNNIMLIELEGRLQRVQQGNIRHVSETLGMTHEQRIQETADQSRQSRLRVRIRSHIQRNRQAVQNLMLHLEIDRAWYRISWPDMLSRSFIHVNYVELIISTEERESILYPLTITPPDAATITTTATNQSNNTVSNIDFDDESSDSSSSSSSSSSDSEEEEVAPVQTQLHRRPRMVTHRQQPQRRLPTNNQPAQNRRNNTRAGSTMDYIDVIMNNSTTQTQAQQQDERPFWDWDDEDEDDVEQEDVDMRDGNENEHDYGDEDEDDDDDEESETTAANNNTNNNLDHTNNYHFLGPRARVPFWLFDDNQQSMEDTDDDEDPFLELLLGRPRNIVQLLDDANGVGRPRRIQDDEQPDPIAALPTMEQASATTTHLSGSGQRDVIQLKKIDPKNNAHHDTKDYRCTNECDSVHKCASANECGCPNECDSVHECRYANECSICFTEGQFILWNESQNKIATLADMDASIVEQIQQQGKTDEFFTSRSSETPQDLRNPNVEHVQQQQLKDETIIANPCGHQKHTICIGCLRRCVTGRENHPINENNAAVPCLYPFQSQPCPAAYYDLAHFKWVLSPTEYNFLAQRYNEYRFPGFEIVKCPGHFNATIRTIENVHGITHRYVTEVRRECNCELLVQRETIRTSTPGSLVIECDQNEQCNCRFCYHCRRLLRDQDSACVACTTISETENPRAWNHFFMRPIAMRGWSQGCQPTVVVDDSDGSDNEDFQQMQQPTKRLRHTYEQPQEVRGPYAHLLRNEELTKELALEQIREVCNQTDRFWPKCFECGVHMHKTAECNGMCHCGIEQCYVCGRCMPKGQNLPENHWDPDGERGCARWDTDPYWLRVTSFRCQEDRCYGHERECTRENHQEGIKEMHEVRKYLHIIYMIRSLPSRLRQDVANVIVQEYGSKEPMIVQWLERNSNFVRITVPQQVPENQPPSEIN